MLSHEITVILYRTALTISRKPPGRKTFQAIGSTAMAGGEGFGSGQIPAVGVAGGEGKREGEHEEVLRYLWVVLGRLGVAGVGLPMEGRIGGRRRTAAG
jgi:hypothetical protein